MAIVPQDKSGPATGYDAVKYWQSRVTWPIQQQPLVRPNQLLRLQKRGHFIACLR